MLHRKLTPVSVLPKIPPSIQHGGAMDAVVHHFEQREVASSRLFLAADVGGTHARVALMRAAWPAGRAPELLNYRTYACADYAGLPELLQAYVDEEVRGPVRQCVLACAGQLHGDEVLNDNLAWPVHPSRVRYALGLDEVAVLNDFEALGHALGALPAGSTRLLCGPDVAPRGATLVIGPGTGLGAAVRMEGPAGAWVLPSEAGQGDFAPHSVREREILAYLAPDGGYVPYERIVSGPGLLTLYTTLCHLRGQAPRLQTPQAVTAAAMAATDAEANEAAQVFCAALGSFAGSLAMTFTASGGVYLAGGFLHALFGLLERSEFVERFLHERSARAFLSRVPVRVMDHGRHGVLGAAAWYLRRGSAVLQQGIPA